MAARRVERDRAIRDLEPGAAVKRLEQAVNSNSSLSAPTELLERLHPQAAVGPPRQVWTTDARQQLKMLRLDDAMIADLLWAVGLVSRHPAGK